MSTFTTLWGAAERRNTLLFMAALVLGSGLWRLSATWLSGAGLFVDEAQYWDWSRELAWGYFSKPPVLPLLMRLSTWFAGDSLTGVRWLVVFVWTLTPLVLWRLTRDMLRNVTDLDARTRSIAGAWAAALCSAMLASALLGQASTTDGPLLFFWSLLMWSFWRAQQAPEQLASWVLVGLFLTLAILSKYTAMAAGASLVWLAWQLRQRLIWRGLFLAFMVCAVLLSPHLAWNHLNAWPTLRHTTELLGSSQGAEPASSWASAFVYILSQGLLIGPVVLVVALLWLVLYWRKSPAPPMTTRGPAGRLSLMGWSWSWAWPIWLAGLLQSLWGKSQMNWPAPALLALTMVMALWRARRPALTWSGPWVVWIAGTVVGATISLAGDWRQHLIPGSTGPRWDLWSRAKGWDSALLAMKPHLDNFPALQIVSSERALIAHAAYTWRDQNRRVQAWSPTVLPAHHYEMVNPYDPKHPQNAGDSVLMISTEEKPWGHPWLEFFPHRHLLHRHSESGRTVFLWKLDPP
jgi:4-amino-4-deoxy-L-arabinose transferase-like glycosyltransferase